MCRVLLVDESFTFLKLVRTIIQGQYAEECEFFYAQNGREAVEKADYLKPDIIFLDIHLPGLNGIQVMQEIRSFDYCAIFIVMTDCRSFESAREAIGQRVMAYFLKPVKPEMILEAMREAIAKVYLARKNGRQNKKIHEKPNIVTPMIEGEFIRALTLQANLMSHVNDYKEILDIQERCGFVMVVQFTGERKNYVGAGKVCGRYISGAQYETVKKKVRESFPSVVGSQINGRIVFFVPWSQLAYDGSGSQNHRSKACKILSKLSFSGETSCRIGVGELHSLERCGESYSEALEELKSQEKNTHRSEFGLGVRNEAKMHVMELENALMKAVELHDMDDMHKISKILFEQIARSVENQIKEMKIHLLGTIMMVENESLPKTKHVNGIGCRTEYLKELSSKKTKEQLYDWLLEKILLICSCMENGKREKNADIIMAAKHYIEQNFSEGISLDSVAEVVGISPCYLSKLFKSSTGENFIDYLTELRIGQAKILLRQKKINMKEISERCGYKNPAYFSRIFKKCMRISPSAYQKSTMYSDGR